MAISAILAVCALAAVIACTTSEVQTPSEMQTPSEVHTRLHKSANAEIETEVPKFPSDGALELVSIPFLAVFECAKKTCDAGDTIIGIAKDLALKGVSEALGAIPVIGPILKGIFGLFFGGGGKLTADEIWNLIKHKVDMAIGDAIRNAQVEAVADELKAVRTDLRLYSDYTGDASCHDDKRAYLNSALSRLTHLQERIAGYVMCHRETGQNYVGKSGDQDVRSYERVTTVEDCSARCTADDACTYFVYQKRSKRCWLKKNYTHKKAERGLESGFKCFPQAPSSRRLLGRRNPKLPYEGGAGDKKALERAMLGFLPQVSLLHITAQAERMETSWRYLPAAINKGGCNTALKHLEEIIHHYTQYSRQAIFDYVKWIKTAYSVSGPLIHDRRRRPGCRGSRLSGHHCHYCVCASSVPGANIDIPARVKHVSSLYGTTSYDCREQGPCVSHMAKKSANMKAKYQKDVTDVLNKWRAFAKTLRTKGYCEHAAWRGNSNQAERMGLKSFLKASFENGKINGQAWRAMDGEAGRPCPKRR